jgi:hypothetical protein
MLLEKKEYLEKNGKIGYVESVFDSSNLLKTTYFPDQNKLYVAFNKGPVYSYTNISQELYDEFEKAESQGRFFIKAIKSAPDKYPYRKEFSLYPSEIGELREVVKKKLDEIKKDDDE